MPSSRDSGSGPSGHPGMTLGANTPPWPTTTTSRSTAIFRSKPGVVDEVRPGVRRILCNNPSPFTFTGTVSYIVGKGKVAIIDPGPDNEEHAAALLDAVRNETVTHILVTHTHRDHSPNTARIKAATGATVYAEGPHRASRPRFESEKHSPESGADRDFRPDVEVSDGDVIEGADWRWRRWRRRATPPIIWRSHGRIAKCLRRRSRDGLVDLDRGAAGRIDDRLHGLARRLTQRRRGFVFLRPRAGNPGRPALCALPDPPPSGARGLDPASPRKGEADIPTIVRAIYIGIDPRLTDGRRLFGAGASGGSGRARHRCDRGDPVIGGRYRLAVPSRLPRWPRRARTESQRMCAIASSLVRRCSRRCASGIPSRSSTSSPPWAGFGRRHRLLHRFEVGAVGGCVDVVDQLADARGVAAEIALEIARRRADIDA